MRLVPLLGVSMMIGCLHGGPAQAQGEPCVSLLANGETEFVQRDHVPPYPDSFCYTFTVQAGKHVALAVTRVEKMRMGIEVREPGMAEYHDLYGSVTSFSNAEKVGRIMMFASTDTDAKEFKVYVSAGKTDPDTSQEFTFQVTVK